MSLSSSHLDAFISIARTLSFSKAAEKLYVTQSALSQRIRALEDELGTTLFIRHRSGLRLTETAERLLRYVQLREQLEGDFLSNLKSSNKHELVGLLRVAGYSSIMRSVIMPALAPLLREHSKIIFDFRICETYELSSLLKQSHVDFIVTDSEVADENIEIHKLGVEKYVAIESKKFPSHKDVFLDHDADDRSTINFFKSQQPSHKLQRSYIGDVYGILEGVSLGLGRAVMSEHLLKQDKISKELRLLSGYKARSVPVYLSYYRQPYYSQLHQTVINQLRSQVPTFL